MWYILKQFLSSLSLNNCYMYIYIVNKPLSTAGISEDNTQGWKIVRKMNSWPRSEASRATVKFWGQSFSRGHYPPIYQQAGKGYIYFITLRIISKGELTQIVPAYFVDFFCVFLGAELSTSFLFIRHWLLQKVFLGFPWPIRSLAWTFARFLVFLPSK